jgi:nucleoredoxin
MKPSARFLLLVIVLGAGAFSSPVNAQSTTGANASATPAAPTPPAKLPSKANWTWTMNDGSTYQNVKVIGIDPADVTILYDGGGTKLPLANLPVDIQTQLNYAPPPPPPKFTPTSVIARMVRGNLLTLRDGVEQPVDDSAMGPVKYFAIYYSAQWCHTCRAFTPTLVKFYNDFKPSHPNFEIIFVSEDGDPNAMLGDMKGVSMPWPAVRYDALVHPDSAPTTPPANTFKSPAGIESFANIGIPDLVLVDATGKVLSDSWNGTQWLGPWKVVADIKKMVP